jgi:ornithine cyclodeaminase
MRILTAQDVNTALGSVNLTDRLRTAFRSENAATQTLRIGDPASDASDASLVISPSWVSNRFIGIRAATHFPDNLAKNMPNQMGVYILLSGKSGQPLALVDGPSLDQWARSAIAALGASYLARPDCERLLIAGVSPDARRQIAAHAGTRPIRNVLIWDPEFGRAEAMATELDRPGFRVTATDDLEGAVRGAHMIVADPNAAAETIPHTWLPSGVHMTLTLNPSSPMEPLLSCLEHGLRTFCDANRERARHLVDDRSNEPSQPVEADHFAADLFEISRGERAGRTRHGQTTVLACLGTGLEDLVAAVTAFERT